VNPRVSTVEQITPSCTAHGEGPIWDAAVGVVRWVDMLNGELLAMQPGEHGDSTVSRRRVCDVAAAMRPRARGGLVVAIERGFALLDDPDDTASPAGALHPLGELWSDPTIRMNEGGCDPQGRFYCGSMDLDLAPGRGTLYRLDPDLSVSTVLEGVSISNGLAWSLDGTEVYYVDSPTQCVHVYRFDAETGTFHDRRTAVSIDAAVGTPDGITVDSEGGIWVALWDGAAVHRYLPDGRLDHVVEVPATRVTACTFGGPALDELYITTSRGGIPDDEQPAAGALFRARPGVRGVPLATFAG
jgi:sugar lactone lactonase YvrE